MFNDTEKKWRTKPILTQPKRFGVAFFGLVVAWVIINKARQIYQNNKLQPPRFAPKLSYSQIELDGIEKGVIGSVLGSILLVALRIFLPRKTLVFQLNKQSKHLRFSAERSMSELQYTTAEKTLKSVQSLLAKRPKLFGVVDHNAISVQETIGLLCGKKGNYREGLSNFRHALALRPSFVNFGWRFVYRAGLVQNHILRGLCYRGLDHHDAADKEFFEAYKCLWFLSLSLNVLSPARWKYLCEVEKELKLHSSLTLHPPETKNDLRLYMDSIEIINSLDGRIQEIYDRASKITGEVDEATLEEGRKVLFNNCNDPSQTFRLVLKLFGLANIFSTVSTQGCSEKQAKEQWLYQALYLYQIVNSCLMYLRNEIPKDTSSIVSSFLMSYKHRFWPPSLLEADRTYTKETLGQQIVSCIVRMAIVRVELHDCIPSPWKAKKIAQLAYNELEFANKLLTQILHDRDLFLQGRVMFYIGATAKRLYNYDEARHAFNAAAACIEAIPRTEEKVKVDAFLGIIKKFAGLMHLVFGEIREAEQCFDKAHKIYFGTSDDKKLREYGKILDCQGQLLYTTGDYIQSLLCYESAAKYEILYRSLSQQNLAYQLQVLNILKPSKVLRKIIVFIENRLTLKSDTVDKQIKEAIEANNENLVQSLENYKTRLNDITLVLNDVKSDMYDYQKPVDIPSRYLKIFHLLMAKMNEADVFDLKSVPLLIQAAHGFVHVSDFDKGGEVLKVIFDIISKETHLGVYRVEHLIEYLLAASRIDTQRGLLASAHRRLEMTSSLMWWMYRTSAKYQPALVEYLLVRARLVLIYDLLRKYTEIYMRTIQATDGEHKEVIGMFLEDWVPNINEAWENLTTAQYYQKIAYSKDSYETSICNELLGTYFLQTKQYEKAKEYFSSALNSSKAKLGTDHACSIKLQHLMTITAQMESNSKPNPSAGIPPPPPPPRVANPLALHLSATKEDEPPPAPAEETPVPIRVLPPSQMPDISQVLSSTQYTGMFSYDYGEILLFYAILCEQRKDEIGLHSFSCEIKRKFSSMGMPVHPFRVIVEVLEGSTSVIDLLQQLVDADVKELQTVEVEKKTIQVLTKED